MSLRYVGPYGQRGRKRRRGFLLLWKDYFIDDASWTYEVNFDYHKELAKMIERDQHIEDQAK